MRTRRGRSAAVAVVGVVLLWSATTAVAVADTMWVDGNTMEVSGLSNSQMNFGDVCLGSTVSRTVAMPIVRVLSGASSTQFLDGSVVTFVWRDGGGSYDRTVFTAHIADDTVVLPGDWRTRPQGYAHTDDMGWLTVTATPSVVGRVSGQVKVRGVSADGKSVPGYTDVIVTGVAC